MSAEPTIFVVDDDAAVGRRAQSAGKLLGHPVRAFASAAEFLAAYDRERPGCLVLDIRMPGMTGLELQRKLADDGANIPVVMISGHADVRIAVEAMTLGAVTLLEKPFRLDELLAQRSPGAGEGRARSARPGGRPPTPTPGSPRSPRRSDEVLDLIAAGKTNREMADALGLCVRAVEDRRARLMKKVNAGSVAELVRLLTIGN